MGSDGRILVKCHAGCKQAVVIAALKELGFWPEQEKRRRKVVATCDYTDENGALLYQVIREEPKSFKQRYPDGTGG